VKGDNRDGSPDSGANALDPDEFVDPSQWTNELLTSDGAESNPTFAATPEEVTSLESVLEGDSAASHEGAAETAAIPAPTSKPHHLRSIVIALLVLTILGATTFFVLRTLGLLGDETGMENQDIVQPK
ncbi:MAG: hypothetical protein KAI47_18485, partial [Deltaproteobacteria bacterium]|nr:hypothetical protein [Deltaproteobacteria bacterium]